MAENITPETSVAARPDPASAPIPAEPKASPRTRRRWRAKEIRRLIFPPLARLAFTVLSWVPYGVARRVGVVVGGLAWCCLRKERRRAERQLEMALGDRTTERERRRIARGVFQHFGCYLMETPVFARWGPQRIVENLRLDDFDEVNRRFGRIMEKGRGCIIVAPHIGNWELVGSLGTLMWPALIIAKRYKVPGYQKLVHDVRARLGCQVVYQDEPMLAVFRHLKRGGVLGVLPDLDARKLSGIFVPFFGRDAYTADSVAQMSLKIGTPIAVVACLRSGSGFRYDLSRPIWPEEVEGADDPERALTMRWLAEVESVIRRHPDQWAWLHDRWHSTPETVAQRRERQRQRELAAR